MRVIAPLLALLLAACDLIPQTHLERVEDEGVLRVLTRNSATTYYEGPHGATGLEYELVAGFADFLDVKLKLQVPETLFSAWLPCGRQVIKPCPAFQRPRVNRVRRQASESKFLPAAAVMRLRLS